MIETERLIIPEHVKQAIIDHALEITPIESCGYLAGKDGHVSEYYPMTNVDQSPEHFSFDPKEQFKAVKKARSEGLSLVSVVHSHPESPARLSEEDLRLFNDPDPVYIIVSFLADIAGIAILIGLSFALNLGGAVLIENVFALPGIGNLITTAAIRRDYPIIEGGIAFVTLVALVMNLFVDISYTFINPRVNYE